MFAISEHRRRIRVSLTVRRESCPGRQRGIRLVSHLKISGPIQILSPDEVLGLGSGLTQSNYTELTSLYDEYKDKGFVVLAFPSNQFGSQEPGSNAEIKAFACSRYKATFPLFAKIDVNGADTAPVYQFLKGQKGGGILGDGIKWNFGKFLVDKKGNVVERYAPTTSPNSIKVWHKAEESAIVFCSRPS